MSALHSYENLMKLHAVLDNFVFILNDCIDEPI